MSSRGSVCVVLLTAHRLEYAKATLAAALKNLVDTEPIKLHIASDGDSDEYIDTLVKLAKKYNYENVSVSNSQGQGYGANYNAATGIVHTLPDVSFVLPLEDDWTLQSKLDLSALVDVLQDEELVPRAQSIRLGYLGWTQDMFGVMRYSKGMHFLNLMPESPEPHVFSGHPRLETIEYQRRLGLWPEGLNPGETEFNVAHRPEARQGIYWPMTLTAPHGTLFTHEGTERSY